MKDLDKKGWMQQFINMVKQSMADNMMSQEQLSKRSGVSQYTISTWVSGSAKSVNLVHALLICEALEKRMIFDQEQMCELSFCSIYDRDGDMYG